MWEGRRLSATGLGDEQVLRLEARSPLQLYLPLFAR